MSMNYYDTVTTRLPTLTMLSTLFLSCVLLSSQIGSVSAGIAEEQAFYTMARNRFAGAARDDLLYIWHHDCHRRCFYQVEEHFEISCTYDPYVARPRRSVPDVVNSTMKLFHRKIKNYSKENTEKLEKPASSSPFLSKQDASMFLRTKRSADQPLNRNKRGITHECCLTKACSWEEYAEYCHRTPRTTAAMENNCSYS